MSNTFQSRKPTISSADGTLIWAASEGRSAADAPVIVFLPGFSSSSPTFRKQFEDAGLLDKYCLVSIHALTYTIIYLTVVDYV